MLSRLLTTDTKEVVPPKVNSLRVSFPSWMRDGTSAISQLGTLKGAKKKGNSQSGILVPKQVEFTPMHTHRFWFYNTNAAILTPVYLSGLLAAAGCLGTVTNSLMHAIHSSVRVKEVGIFSTVSTGITQADCSVGWNAGVIGTNAFPDSYKGSAFIVGTLISRMVSRPPKGSGPSMWFTADGSDHMVFTVTAPAQAVTYVDLELAMSNNYPSSSYTVATAVVGTSYYGYLDNKIAGGVHNFGPIGLPSTF